MEDTNLVTFFDALGRTIIGEKTGEDDNHLTVKNPVVVNMVPQQLKDPNTGQVIERMALQLLPLFFREFLADKSAGVEYNFNKPNITMTTNDVVFDFKLNVQYTNIFAEQPEVVQPTQPGIPPADGGQEDNVIQLFDN